MDSRPSLPAQPNRGLPPVTPPSGRFIAQLFLVPGAIVLVAVLFILTFRYLLGSNYAPENFLRQLDSDNADIRWRGASDLAQVLKRPESMHLKADATFALDLTERLQAALDDLDAEEKRAAETTAQASAAEKDAAWGKRLDAKRNLVTFLAATMGDFVVPVGVPLLSDIAQRDNSPDPKSILRRRQALSSLINLGNNMKEFAKLPTTQQQQILGVLVTESASSNPGRAAAARNGLYYLDKSRLPSGTNQSIVEVDRVLARVAHDQDQFLRELVAFAFNFWDGPAADATLQELARDPGFGTLVRVQE